jgi:protein-disulfide isomerase
VAAEAAGRQQQFWPMHDMLFEHQNELSDQAYRRFAKTLGLDLSRFDADMQDPALAEKVDADFESGVRSGVNGTPSFYLDGHKYNGGYDYMSLREAIEAQLAHVL